MEQLIPIVAIISLFGSIILFVTVLTNYFLKKKMIEKGMVGDETSHLFKSVSNKQNALKWGLIAFFAGVGLIIIDAMGLDGDRAMPYGIEAVCVSIGFLGYYILARKETEG